MSLKNYKNNKFEYNQPLTYDSLNSLNYNDIILNNELEPMAKGVLAFKETTAYDVVRNIFTPNTSTSDDVLDKYKMFQNLEDGTWNDMSVKFTTKDTRLIKASFFTSMFRVQNLPETGLGKVRFAFFMSTNNSKIELLNSTYKTSGMLKEPTAPAFPFRRYGSVSMNYVFVPPAGTHEIFVGIKAHNCTAILSESSNDGAGVANSRAKRPTQLFIEDLGFPFRSGKGVQYEFQD